MSEQKVVAVQSKFSESEVDRIEAWRRSLRRIPPMGRAIRELVLRGLAAVQSEDGSV